MLLLQNKRYWVYYEASKAREAETTKCWSFVLDKWLKNELMIKIASSSEAYDQSIISQTHPNELHLDLWVSATCLRLNLPLYLQTETIHYYTTLCIAKKLWTVLGSNEVLQKRKKKSRFFDAVSIPVSVSSVRMFQLWSHFNPHRLQKQRELGQSHRFLDCSNWKLQSSQLPALRFLSTLHLQGSSLDKKKRNPISLRTRNRVVNMDMVYFIGRSVDLL